MVGIVPRYPATRCLCRPARCSPLYEYAEVGGLITYGPDRLEGYRRAAVFADKLLKGAKVADLPIEQAGTFDLVINMRTAKALGLTIPQALQSRARLI